MQKLLITGSNGMLGKNITLNSKFKNYKIIPLSRINLDLKDTKKVKMFISQCKPSIAIHCAAKVGGIHDNIENPLDYLNDNILINHNIITACYENKVKKFINIASSCIYPKNLKKKIKENDLLTGKFEETNEGYALSKVYSLKLCNIISQQKGYYYKTIIPCNIYGPYGNFDPKKSHVLPAIIKKVVEADLNKKKTVEMWGDGKAKREFLYVEDLVDFIKICTEKITKIPNNINVGYGKDFKINEFYEKVIKIVNKKLTIKKILNKPTGQKYKLMNIEIARKIGWKPKTSIDDGIKKTIDYYKKNLGNKIKKNKKFINQ